MMQLSVLFFSVLRPLVEAESLEIVVEDGITTGDLLEHLFAKFPGLESWKGKIRVAVDLEYVGSDYVLSDGQEVAVMPPVQGG